MDYEAEHRKLWDLIAKYFKCGVNDLPKNTLEWSIIKKSLLNSMGYDSSQVYNQCFACSYAIHNIGYSWIDCKFCPLKWNWGRCGEAGSEYDEFTHALYLGERSKAIELAECIRDLPWED